MRSDEHRVPDIVWGIVANHSFIDENQPVMADPRDRLQFQMPPANLRQHRPVSDIVEVGCGEGRISAMLLQRCPSAFVYAIDSFSTIIDGDPHRYPQLAACPRADRAAENLQPYKDRMILLRQDSIKACDSLNGRMMDVVILDGAADTHGMFLDLMAWKRKVRPSGLIIVARYYIGEVRVATDRFCKLYSYSVSDVNGVGVIVGF